jgi:hypothetical protein
MHVDHKRSLPPFVLRRFFCCYPLCELPVINSIARTFSPGDQPVFRDRLRASLADVGQALREPEAFALRWHTGEAPYGPAVFAALALTAITGTTTYGFVMGLMHGSREMLLDGLRCTAAAGLAWGVSLPALYVLNSLAGSRLRASTTFLAALVTTSWGGLAMIAAIPVSWFFTVAIPKELFVLFVHLAVFALVGIAMTDVFGRVMSRLEPRRGWLPVWWLLLVAAVGCELYYAFGLFKFSVLREFLQSFAA